MKVLISFFLLVTLTMKIYCSEKINSKVSSDLESFLSDELPNKNKILDVNRKILNDLLKLKKIETQRFSRRPYRPCFWKICSPPLKKTRNEIKYNQNLKRFVHVMKQLMLLNSVITKKDA